MMRKANLFALCDQIAELYRKNLIRVYAALFHNITISTGTEQGYLTTHLCGSNCHELLPRVPPHICNAGHPHLQSTHRLASGCHYQCVKLPLCAMLVGAMSPFLKADEGRTASTAANSFCHKRKQSPECLRTDIAAREAEKKLH